MRFIKYILILGVILGVVAVAAGYFGLNRVHQPYKGFDSEETFVEVAPGSGPATIGRQLIQAGVVRDELTFRAALWLSGRARELTASRI